MSVLQVGILYPLLVFPSREKKLNQPNISDFYLPLYLLHFTQKHISNKTKLKLVKIFNEWILRLMTQHPVQMKYERNVSSRDQNQRQK